MLTPEREKEIKEILECHHGIIEPIAKELLSEIDRLRAENQDLNERLLQAARMKRDLFELLGKK